MAALENVDRLVWVELGPWTIMPNAATSGHLLAGIKPSRRMWYG